MFTGIIEEVGQVKRIAKNPKSVALTVQAKTVLEDTKIGDSIATNGICLTVTNMTKDAFTVDVMNETLNRSNMQHLQIGSTVNLERALTLQTRLGGHMVSGHVDGIGTITSITKVDIAHLFKINASKDLLKYIVKKGSVAIDGISLTVVDVDHESFQVSIIPHTKDETTLFSKRIGDTLNIECDMVGKYIEKLLKTNKEEQGITKDMLQKYGF